MSALDDALYYVDGRAVWFPTGEPLADVARAELRALREALEPFARLALGAESLGDDKYVPASATLNLKMGEVRRAYEVLHGKESE